MQIYLIRHGETFENVNTMLMGRTHGQLSSRGREQAQKTGVALKEKEIKYMYSSPLLRCVDTAEIMNNILHVPFEKDELLIERDFGVYTNATTETIDFNTLDEDSIENNSAGVETLEQVRGRMCGFMEKISKTHPVDDVVVVTHNNPIRLFLGDVLGKTYQEILKEYKIHNCGINIFKYTDAYLPSIVSLDDVSHLV